MNFRHIKITMHMDVLRCQSPKMVRIEIWVHLLAYNLIRSLMYSAARTGPERARQLSVKGTIQHVLAFRERAPADSPQAEPDDCLMMLVGRQIVPYRPERIEPRVRKRRPKNYRLMTRPRAELKAALRS